MPARQSYTQYTVAKGDTLSAIAKKFNTTVAAIAATSGIADPNKISVGQVLSIATGTYDPDVLDLAEVQVTAKRLPVPYSPPSIDPIAGAVMTVGEWLKPPKLWVTLAVAAGVGYYLLSDDKPRKRK